MLAKLKSELVTARNNIERYTELYQHSLWDGYLYFAQLERAKELRLIEEIKNIETRCGICGLK